MTHPASPDARPNVLPFLDEFHDAVRNGVKTCTSRSKRYGQVGDVLDTSAGVRVRLLHVERVTLDFVATQFYQQEGFATPADFLAKWQTIHPRRVMTPTDRVWLHVFQVVESHEASD